MSKPQKRPAILPSESGYAEYAFELSAKDVAQMGVKRVLRLLRALDENPVLSDLNHPEVETLRVRIRTGLVNNPMMRDWYNHVRKTVEEEAYAEVPYVWRGHVAELDKRRGRALQNLSRNMALSDWFMVRHHTELAVREIFNRHGVLAVPTWRRNRMLAGLFPRDTRLRPYPVSRRAGYGSAFARFCHDVQESFEGMPRYFRHFLFESGQAMRLANVLGAIDPAYAEKRISSLGGTFEQVAIGVYTPNLRMIDLPRLNRDSERRTYLAHRPDTHQLSLTIAHEGFHAVDEEMGISRHRPELLMAYRGDVAELKTRRVERHIRRHFGYFLTKADSGEHDLVQHAAAETLVESAAELMLADQGLETISVSGVFHRTASKARGIITTMLCDYALFPTGLEFPWGEDMHDTLQAAVALGKIRQHQLVPEAR